MKAFPFYSGEPSEYEKLKPTVAYEINPDTLPKESPLGLRELKGLFGQLRNSRGGFCLAPLTLEKNCAN